jgi:ubiquinone/menaquinone biosynthesis C-methylase UbiE
MKMEINRREIQAKLLKYGGLYNLLRKTGIITIIDFAVTTFINIIFKKLKYFYRLRSTDYGLLEALFYPRNIDQWSRYAHVVNEIKKFKTKGKILEVGSGESGIISFFFSQEYEIFLVDIREDVFKGLRRAHCIVGDGCRLPFRDKAFDIVISVDTVEHIPKPIRHNFYKELKRVAREKIILSCPLQSNDGMFQGKNYDIIFQTLYEKIYGVKEPNTAQHIAAGHPTLEEIKKEFSDPIIHGYKNCEVWLKYMLFSHKPLLGLFCGLLYCLLWKKDDKKPPFYGAIIVISNLT